MKINRDITVSEIEELVNSITLFEHLTLPRTQKKLRIGLLPRLIQLYITLFKIKPSTQLKFYTTSLNNQNEIQELLRDPASTSALLMAKTVLDKSNYDLKKAINKDIAYRFNTPIFISGQRAQLFAIDHSTRKYAFPSCFYSIDNDPKIRGSEYFSNILLDFMRQKSKGSDLTYEETDDLGEIIFELIENTEQHSKTEFNSGYCSKSIRGLIIDYRLVNKKQSLENIGGSESTITEYLKTLRKKPKPTHLLELSFFDSGVGIYKSMCKNTKNIQESIEDEANIVLRSFQKGETSKKNSIGFGRGLDNVKILLNKRSGYIHIRTGRLSLYRDFASTPLTEQDESFLFFDEQTKSNEMFSSFGQVEGLSVSILVAIK